MIILMLGVYMDGTLVYRPILVLISFHQWGWYVFVMIFLIYHYYPTHGSTNIMVEIWPMWYIIF